MNTSTETMKSKLFASALMGLASANKGNPFWTKGEAMALVNQTRALRGAL